jgi:hypothetical protein
MNLFKMIVDEAVGMFVDDGMLALLCVVLVALVATAIWLLSLPALWGGLLLLVGCIAILAGSVLRAVK